MGAGAGIPTGTNGVPAGRLGLGSTAQREELLGVNASRPFARTGAQRPDRRAGVGDGSGAEGGAARVLQAQSTSSERLTEGP